MTLPLFNTETHYTKIVKKQVAYETKFTSIFVYHVILCHLLFHVKISLFVNELYFMCDSLILIVHIFKEVSKAFQPVIPVTK